MDNQKSRIVELNVGGSNYTTTLGTLTRDPSTLLAQYFNGLSLSSVSQGEGLNTGSILSTTPSTTPLASPLQPLSNGAQTIQRQIDGSFFIDRDGELFRYILDYLRNGKLLLPDNFQHTSRLREEAKFFKISELIKLLRSAPTSRRANVNGAILPALVNGGPIRQVSSDSSNANSGHVTVGYRGTFAFGRDGQADVKFRKLTRIIVCGKASMCREIFGDTLNESRDPDRGGENRYTARLYLKHSSLELAFDTLAERGFTLITSCASGTCASGDLIRGSAADSEEQKWNHYNEFVFYRPPE